MDKIKICVRIDKRVYEAVLVLARNNGDTIQNTIEDLLKLGYTRWLEINGYEK